MKQNITKMVSAVRRGEARAVAQAISLIEDENPQSIALQNELLKSSKKAFVIGITGAPGAGKSTLVDQLAHCLQKKKHKVAILAIDPSSPFSGGAVLGDRIRMSRAEEAKDVFIRSMASRGSLGGMSRATLGSLLVLDAAGFDIVLIETVGVGQAEIDIVRAADTCVVVLVPGMGDSVQAIKAGIVEIADIFVVNKSDRPGADLVHKDIKGILSLVEYTSTDWRPVVLSTIASEGQGIGELSASIFQHKTWQTKSKSARVRRIKVMQQNLVEVARDIEFKRLFAKREKLVRSLAEKCVDRKLCLDAAAKLLLKRG